MVYVLREECVVRRRLAPLTEKEQECEGSVALPRLTVSLPRMDSLCQTKKGNRAALGCASDTWVETAGGGTP